MADNNFVVTTSGGQEFRTGLQIPDKIPLTFAEYPASDVFDLPLLKKIYASPGRKLATDIYTLRKQQGQCSSCAPYATTTAGEVKRKFDRKEDIEYGPEWLYSLVNGGQDQGALLDDCMLAFMGLDPRSKRESAGYGCCLRASVPYQTHTTRGMTMEQKRFAAQQAEDYRALNWRKMPHGNLDACWAATITAIAARNPVLMAVHCGDGFFSCGPDGVCRVDRGPGNHAVCGVDLLGVSTARSFRDIKIITINSHGARFGRNGTYLHTYDHMAEPCNYHQHCACDSMRTSPDEKITTLLGAT
jgi:hypothetical protein